MPTGLFYLNSLGRVISSRDVWFLLVSCFVEISVDPDQMPCFAASDLGLHCLPMSLIWDARLKWVNSDYFQVSRFIQRIYSLLLAIT